MVLRREDAPIRVGDFSLPDHRGVNFSSAVALIDSPLVIVFFRGHWCPYCRRYLAKLQANFYRIDSAGARLIAISPEPPATSAALVAQLRLSFPILSDPEGRIIDFFGVRNGFSHARTLIPHPAVFVVDAGSVVRFGSIDRNYKKRTTIRTILAAVAEVRASDCRLAPSSNRR